MNDSGTVGRGSRLPRLLVIFAITASSGVAVFSLMRAGRQAEREPEPGAISASDEEKAPPQAGESPVRKLMAATGREMPVQNPGIPQADRLLGELEALFAALSGMERSASVRLLEDFLSRGNDAPLPFEFRVGSKGVVSRPTTLRVAVLDFFGRIDPQASAVTAREIFTRSKSPDEWAVSMRNYAWSVDRTPDEYLRQVVDDYLSRGEWIARPTSGYLHGFDAAAFVGGAGVAAKLMTLLAPETPTPVRFAAYLALDRLAVAEPVAVLGLVAEKREILAGEPEFSARLIARGDPADPEQRALMDSYLKTAGAETGEIAAFAANFPNFDVFGGDSLLTEANIPLRSQIVERDKAALALVDHWLANSPTPALVPYLSHMRARLQRFQKSAAIGDEESNSPP